MKKLEVFSSSIPAGKMVISTSNFFPKYNKLGYIIIRIYKDNEYGKIIDSKKFEFKSQGEYPSLNGSNESFNNARDSANIWYREQSNLWYNKSKYDELSIEDIELLREVGNTFWDDEHITKEKVPYL